MIFQTPVIYYYFHFTECTLTSQLHRYTATNIPDALAKHIWTRLPKMQVALFFWVFVSYYS